MQDLCWDNFLDLVELIEKHNFKEQWLSPIQLVTFPYYGLSLKFNILNNKEIVLYVKLDKKFFPDATDYWYFSQVYYDKESNIDNLKENIKKDLLILNNSNEEFLGGNLSWEMVNDFGFASYDLFESKVISNYIYELNSLKTFVGKKMQKKRNHLNFFINNFASKTIIKDIREVALKDIFNYFEYHMKNYGDEYREYELEIYRNFLTNFLNQNKNFSGIVLYFENQIVGVTLGFLRKNVYEIIIEKANHDLRGVHQFLIQNNLIKNNINCPYIDRQDDGAIEALAISKHSYHPIYEIKRYWFKK